MAGLGAVFLVGVAFTLVAGAVVVIVACVYAIRRGLFPP